MHHGHGATPLDALRRPFTYSTVHNSQLLDYSTVWNYRGQSAVTCVSTAPRARAGLPAVYDLCECTVPHPQNSAVLYVVHECCLLSMSNCLDGHRTERSVPFVIRVARPSGSAATEAPCHLLRPKRLFCAEQATENLTRRQWTESIRPTNQPSAPPLVFFAQFGIRLWRHAIGPGHPLCHPIASASLAPRLEGRPQFPLPWGHNHYPVPPPPAMCRFSSLTGSVEALASRERLLEVVALRRGACAGRA